MVRRRPEAMSNPQYHIWIECPVAGAIWKEMEEIWTYLEPSKKPKIPTKVNELIAYMALCPVDKGPISSRRWQILYQTAIDKDPYTNRSGA